ncbi:MAG: ATP-binding protein [Myxococcaceae bacterium]
MTPALFADVTMALVTSATFLAIAVLSVIRGRRGGSQPVSLRLSLFCVDIFLYDVCQALSDLSPDPIWRQLRDGIVALAPALFYHLVVRFVGKRSSFKVPLAVAYGYCTLIGLACLAPIVSHNAPDIAGHKPWALLLLGALVPMLIHAPYLLTEHMRNASAPERARTRMVLAAGLIAGLANATDLADIAEVVSSLRLGQAGLLISGVLLAVAALRVLEGVSLLTFINAVSIGLSVALSEVAVFKWAGQNLALATVGSLGVLMVTLVAARLVVADYAAYRERLLAHATLGRMAAQMAHDIKNPLQAIKLDAQFLLAEIAAGRSIDARAAKLQGMVEECDVLNRRVEDYRRIGKAEPQLSSADLNELVQHATRFLGGGGAVEVKLAEKLPAVQADRDLLVIALENVLRNAKEAAPGKPIVVETGTAADFGDGGAIFVSVRDQGPGMDARTRERALEGFFSTKTQGSGLGLAFVRRVVEAHDGRLSIASHEGQGTTVRIELRA